MTNDIFNSDDECEKRLEEQRDYIRKLHNELSTIKQQLRQNESQTEFFKDQLDRRTNIMKEQRAEYYKQLMILKEQLYQRMRLGDGYQPDVLPDFGTNIDWEGNDEIAKQQRKELIRKEVQKKLNVALKEQANKLNEKHRNTQELLQNKLEQQKEDFQKESQMLESQLIEYQNKCEKNISDLQERNDEILHLRQDVTKLTKTNLDVESQLGDLQKTAQNDAKTAINNQILLDRLQKENKEKDLTIQSYENDLIQLQQQIKDVEMVKKAEFDKIQKQFDEKNHVQAESQSELTDRVNKLNKTIDILSLELDTSQEHEKSLEDELQHANLEIEKLRDHINTLNEDLKEVDAADASTNQRLVDSFNTMASLREQLAAKNKETKMQLEKIVELENEVFDLRNDISLVERPISSVNESDLVSSNNRNVENLDYKENVEVQSLKKENERLMQAKINLQKEIDILKRKNQTLLQQLDMGMLEASIHDTMSVQDQLDDIIVIQQNGMSSKEIDEVSEKTGVDVRSISSRSMRNSSSRCMLSPNNPGSTSVLDSARSSRTSKTDRTDSGDKDGLLSNRSSSRSSRRSSSRASTKTRPDSSSGSRSSRSQTKTPKSRGKDRDNQKASARSDRRIRKKDLKTVSVGVQVPSIDANVDNLLDNENVDVDIVYKDGHVDVDDTIDQADLSSFVSDQDGYISDIPSYLIVENRELKKQLEIIEEQAKLHSDQMGNLRDENSDLANHVIEITVENETLSSALIDAKHLITELEERLKNKEFESGKKVPISQFYEKKEVSSSLDLDDTPQIHQDKPKRIVTSATSKNHVPPGDFVVGPGSNDPLSKTTEERNSSWQVKAKKVEDADIEMTIPPKQTLEQLQNAQNMLEHATRLANISVNQQEVYDNYRRHKDNLDEITAKKNAAKIALDTTNAIKTSYSKELQAKYKVFERLELRAKEQKVKMALKLKQIERERQRNLERVLAAVDLLYKPATPAFVHEQFYLELSDEEQEQEQEQEQKQHYQQDYQQGYQQQSQNETRQKSNNVNPIFYSKPLANHNKNTCIDPNCAICRALSQIRQSTNSIQSDISNVMPDTTRSSSRKQTFPKTKKHGDILNQISPYRDVRKEALFNVQTTTLNRIPVQRSSSACSGLLKTERQKKKQKNEIFALSTNDSKLIQSSRPTRPHTSMDSNSVKVSTLDLMDFTSKILTSKKK
eukprot:TRINITY_DN1809_c0_g2_i1.p1 TRINITY_DN1809_c0_g2~~TRINITY_DN1809_c0_g2_i1.p1  ORF type:complete len:1197 (-),score=327.49 TRINITY_DN1809_c0_g2_i1:31-3621(-)